MDASILSVEKKKETERNELPAAAFIDTKYTKPRRLQTPPQPQPNCRKEAGGARSVGVGGCAQAQ